MHAIGITSAKARRAGADIQTRPWTASQFTASDDRVRGGKSQSYLTVLDPWTPGGPSPGAEFHGTLDIAALGGAGFASQRTVDDFPALNLSEYDSLVLDVARSDGKRYTLTLKDQVPPKTPDGGDQSSVSWEYDFVVGPENSTDDGSPGAGQVVIPFKDLQPTYRGSPDHDAEPLDLGNVRRISFMMRR